MFLTTSANYLNLGWRNIQWVDGKDRRVAEKYKTS